jgi:hypothetical protein
MGKEEAGIPRIVFAPSFLLPHQQKGSADLGGHSELAACVRFGFPVG